MASKKLFDPKEKAWTTQEQWVWTCVRNGLVANFNNMQGYGGRLDPSTVDGWSNTRILRPEFLQFILFSEDVSERGVRIVGAHIVAPLDLSYRTLTKQLWLDFCRFENALDLEYLRSHHLLSFEHSYFAGPVNLLGASIQEQFNIWGAHFADRLQMSQLDVQGIMFMHAGKFSNIEMVTAHITRSLDMSGSEFNGNVVLESLRVGEHLYMDAQAKFTNVALSHAHVTGTLELSHALFTDTLTMDDIHVGGQLNMGEGRFCKVILDNATVVGNLKTAGSKFTDHFSAQGLHIGRHLDMEKGEYESVDLSGSQVKSNLSVAFSRCVGTINLTSMQIGESLGMLACQFADALLMQNARIGGHLDMRQNGKFTSADLSGSRIDGSIFVNGAEFSGAMQMAGIHIGGNLDMSENAMFRSVDLSISNIGASVLMAKSSFTGDLIMVSLQAGGHLVMSDAHFLKVDLSNAKIDRGLSLNTSEVAGHLKMDSIQIGGYLNMSDRAIFSKVNLSAAKITGCVSIVNTQFNGDLNMESVHVDAHVLMASTQLQAVSLRGAHIGGYIKMSDLSFADILVMESAKISSHLEMRNSKFRKVRLSGSKIGGDVSLGASQFVDNLDMDSAEVSGHLFMNKHASFASVNISAATVAGILSMDDSRFTKDVYMHTVKINGHLRMLRAFFDKECTTVAVFARIRGNIELLGSTLASLNLLGTKIGGDFRLGQDPDGQHLQWHPESVLSLRNAEVAAIQEDQEQAWPSQIELDGFQYKQLGGSGRNTDIARRDVNWFCAGWLGRHQPYSPQPYEQLAGVLVKSGDKDKAEEILYEGKKRQRREMKRGLEKVWSTLLYLSIGYGYRSISRVLLWTIVFTVLGTIVVTMGLWTSTLDVTYLNNFQPGYLDSLSNRMAYSLDKFLPIIKLRLYHHSQIQLNGWVGWYFDIHQIMGYLLASLLIAGLTGLARR